MLYTEVKGRKVSLETKIYLKERHNRDQIKIYLTTFLRFNLKMSKSCEGTGKASAGLFMY